MPRHHCDYNYPHWTLELQNNLFHQAVTVAQRMKATPENLTIIHNLIMSLTYEYLQKLRILDEFDDLRESIKWENTA